MYRLHLSLLTVSIAATVAFAQSGPQAEQIPACVKECDPAAIASVNCTNEDQHCHCVRQDGILANITACADRSCDNPDDDIKVTDGRVVFTKLFDEVCQQFNITVPATEGYSSSDIHDTTERWSNNYGGSGGNSGGNYGSGGGGWRGGAASNIVTDTLLGWTLGGVACAITLNLMV